MILSFLQTQSKIFVFFIESEGPYSHMDPSDFCGFQTYLLMISKCFSGSDYESETQTHIFKHLDNIPSCVPWRHLKLPSPYLKVHPQQWSQDLAFCVTRPWIHGLERSPEERNGYQLQYPCLENSRDRGTWQTAAHGSRWDWAPAVITYLLMLKNETDKYIEVQKYFPRPREPQYWILIKNKPFPSSSFLPISCLFVILNHIGWF